MDASKWRISKACQECRTRKVRCNGEEPCQRCTVRGTECIYRTKARNRTRKSSPGRATSRELHESLPDQKGLENLDSQLSDHGAQGIQNHSVAATHRASPSMSLQLFYGSSSNFSMLHSIYHQIEGTRQTPSQHREVEEIGPGLDLFGNRRLYFGDLADNNDTLRMESDYSAMFLNQALASQLMERYLATYWHVLPVVPKDEYRRRLSQLYGAAGIFSFDDPDIIVILLAMAIGASMLEQEPAAQFLFQKAKQGYAKLDDMFYAERARPNSAFLNAGTAVRKAIAAGLHRDVTAAGQAPGETRQRRITIWSLYFWETWICFSLGRPSSIPESELSVPPVPEEKLLQSLCTLARIMATCAARIYNQKHTSLLPMWNAANEIRRDLIHFAKQQRQEMDFGLVGDPSTGELGVCQTMVSTMYHHTLLLTFRPFLVLRAKLRHEAAIGGHPVASRPSLPPWLDSACEQCIDAARHSVGFLSGACEQNMLCREIKYHGFFLEGACHVLAFDLLQGDAESRRNLPWLRSGIRTLRSMAPKAKGSPAQTSVTMANVETMVRAVIPDFRVDGPPVDFANAPQQVHGETAPAMSNTTATQPSSTMASYLYPSMPFGLDANGSSSTQSPITINLEEQIDLTAADMGFDFDFATMDMEAFLSIDPNIAANYLM